ncbi:MAG: single-stranded-DNA-specific exonuclease RecJ [Flavobacteriales bacterium]
MFVKTPKRWKVKEVKDESKVEALSEALKVSHQVARLLLQRNIETYDDARRFFRPTLADLHDPFLMRDMDKAVERIKTAIEKKEKILIYGDYDVDGTTAVTLVYGFFKKIYPADLLDYYIPDRYSEGYGISFQGIDFAADHGFSLIIALDCGIKSIDKVNYAHEKGVDFIICDHHLPGAEIPTAAAVLDPKRSDCPYPYKELSGCGIGFKLIQALNHSLNLEQNVFEWLDLTALSIAADIVPITDENRVLAYHGLKQINESPRHGIRTLLASKLKPAKESETATDELAAKEITITDLVFIAAPRVNAAGRIEHGSKAVDLLLSEDEEYANAKGVFINDHNSTRKDLDQQITREALEMIAQNAEMQNRKSTVVFHPEWHKGVIGIVASRLIENYYRPTIVLTESNGKAVGSARSVKGFDVHQAIEACGDLLEQFGGHKYAAGLTMKLENVENFIHRFEQVVNSTISDDLLVPEVEIDLHLDPDAITPKFYRIIKQFAPFGPGNMTPVFSTSSARSDGFARIVGGNHLKMRILSDNGAAFDAIGFQLGEYLPLVNRQKTVSLCFQLDENHWNGKTSLQMILKDIKI